MQSMRRFILKIPIIITTRPDTEVSFSGTLKIIPVHTSDKKGVMLSSANLIANITYTEFEQGDEVLLSVLPMHHIFCFTSDYFKSLLEGFTVCLNGDLSKMGENLARFQPTTMRMVPMIAETLIRKINILHKRFPQLTAREAAEKVFGKNCKLF